MIDPGRIQGSSDAESSGRRVVQFCSGNETVGVRAASNQYLAILQQRCRESRGQIGAVLRMHAPGGGECSGRGIVYLRAGEADMLGARCHEDIFVPTHNQHLSVVRSVAVKFARPVFKLPVAANVPVPGLYRIALGRPYCSRFLPPAARTCPLFSTVAVKKARWAPILPVTVQVCACTFRLAARNSRNKPSHPGSLVLFINLSFPGVVRNLAFDDLDEQGNFAEQVGGARCSRTSITRNDTRVCLRAIKKL